MADNYVAFDFETANRRRSSACSIGIAVIEDGQVVERGACLIRPPELAFEYTYIHGISEEDVRDEPQFDRLWPRIQHYFDGRRVLAHYAPFDISVLRCSLDAYGLSYPQLDYLCTVRLARELWPGLGAYNLVALSGYFGFELKHHDAGDDAFACAQLALRACQELGSHCLEDLTTEAGIVWGKVWPRGYSRCRRLKLTGRREPGAAPPSRVGVELPNPRHPLFGKTVVFAGVPWHMSAWEAQQKLAQYGATVAELVSDADYVVVGSHWASPPGKSSNLLVAEALAEAGTPIKIISEEDLLKLLTLTG